MTKSLLANDPIEQRSPSDCQDFPSPGPSTTARRNPRTVWMAGAAAIPWVMVEPPKPSRSLSSRRDDMPGQAIRSARHAASESRLRNSDFRGAIRLSLRESLRTHRGIDLAVTQRMRSVAFLLASALAIAPLATACDGDDSQPG